MVSAMCLASLFCVSLIKDNKHNGYFLIVNSDFVSDHVIYIIPLHELTLFMKIIF